PYTTLFRSGVRRAGPASRVGPRAPLASTPPAGRARRRQRAASDQFRDRSSRVVTACRSVRRELLCAVLRRVASHRSDERRELGHDPRLLAEGGLYLVDLSRREVDDAVAQQDVAGAFHRGAQDERGHVLLLRGGGLTNGGERFGGQAHVQAL